MSVTEEASAAANATTDAAPGDTPTANGDEQGGVSLTGTPELSDPAILAVNPKFRYGKEELLKLRDAPLSQRKPDFLDVNEVSPTIWDPTRWNFDRKKSDTPTENGARVGDEHRRRPGDPRERIRKENDGIVLSPQRRSFNSGCCVPGREPRSNANRPHSPLGKNDASAHLGGGGREIPTSRRIGSGRILRDSWDFGEKQEAGADDYNFRPQQRNDNADRRSFGRDFDVGRDKEKERRNGSRFSDRRRIGESRDEEPEWFSGGPSSQNDTIELRGFEESERLGKKKMSPSQAKRARDWFRKKTEVASVTEEKDEISIEGGPGGRSTPTPQAGNGTAESDQSSTAQASISSSNNSEAASGGDGDGKGKQNPEKSLNDQSYIFEDILKSDTIPGLPGLLTNGVGGDGDTNAKSRFSKWFSAETNNTSDSRRSSVQDETIIKSLLKDLNEPSVSIPGDSNSYFAPISPAANTGTSLGAAGGGSKSINIMEMLQRGKQNESAMKSQVSGRIMNLNELEAKMRQNSEPQMHKHAQKSEEDMTAFNRLLAHISSGHNATANGPMAKSQPMSLMEMLSHSQQQDEVHARMAQLLGPASPGASPHDIASRLQQSQQQHKQQQVEMLTKLMNAGMQVRASPLPEMGLQQSRELLNRPEAQAILQGLKVGDITPQHLYQQLANPALQPRHREMLVTILKLQGGGVGPSPRVLSPVAPHPMFQQQPQQQQLRVSPLPPNALHQRIPSPRELQVHTQNILQRALIKKKLEEQQENYRKKQEMQQRGQSPSNNNNNNNNNNAQQPTKSVSSPTPLAFTPTSVLRKMTAEKDEGGKDVSKLVEGGKLSQGRAVTGMRPQTQQQTQQPQQWAPYQMNVKQAGRPIVKANSFQPQQQQEQFFTQQQQQKFLSQLQQQQQRKPPYHGHGSMPGHHPQYPNANNQQFSQLTQQQLRAQHQQHARPSNVQQQGQQQQTYGNQQGSGSWQQYLNPQQSRGQVGRGGLNDGDLSPTSNQLTRWFSPDLLERARVGELPSTAGLSQHLLSLEEIERLTAPPVHN
ncbi:eukaryotic translation initiation factor 4E transporter-like isoform X2 [Tenebrio molitor]|uniref:eukaryotic translation initiation factor 4E transporter-like isoform X2 n=1 Tax=Tenebrio molitor TaxID=7067 RepID=UPI00362473B6